MFQPFPYQEIGAKWLHHMPRALLADEPGLGKTAQLIMACDMVNALKILVVCPASVREVWRREFNNVSKFERNIRVLAGEIMVPKIASQEVVYIISFDGASRYTNELIAIGFDVLIVDESHFCKEIKAKRTKAIFGFRKQKGLVHAAKTIWLASGTPSPNNPLELFPMCRVLFAKSFRKPDGKPMAKVDFINRYCEVKHNGFGLQVVGGKNLPELKRRLAPHMLRRKKSDVLPELPALRREILYLEAQSELAKLTDAETGRMLQELDRKLATATPERRQALLDKIDQDVKLRMRRILGLAKVNTLTAWLRDQLESGMQKVVVFGHHREVLHTLYSNFEKDYAPAMIDGNTAPHKRSLEVDKFQKEANCRMFIGQLTAAGTGITLTAASDLVFAEFGWTPGDNEQPEMRIHRIGQKNSVLIRYAVVAGSLDEKIASVVRRKSSIISQVIN